MGIRVVFEIGEGNFDVGFPVKIRITESGRRNHGVEFSGYLPAAPHLPQKYNELQTIYYNLPANWLITIPKTQVTNISTIGSCQHAAIRLTESLNEWLNQPPVRQLERKILQQVGDWRDTSFILRTNNPLLLRFPWHLWDLFQSSDYAPEIIIGSNYETSTAKLRAPVKILAVFGDNTGINIERDLDALQEKLQGAIITSLVQPRQRELSDYLWNYKWDILFFAGHSCSQQQDAWGEIQLNPEESLPLINLRRSLQHAVKQGLKLAIFNSCDGVGLARNLADLRIPYTIVMREPVPDIVAQHFLEYFLTAFARGESLYTAVREARTRLCEELDSSYPCASWLPIIFQNPATTTLTYPRHYNWQKLLLKTSLAVICGGFLAAMAWSIGEEMRLSQRFSDGNRILDQAIALGSNDKQIGVDALGRGNYTGAIEHLKKYLKANPDDPEALIYLNNAQVGLAQPNQNQPEITIGLAVPIGRNPIVAREIMRGVAQSQQEINQRRGINGRLLKIIIADDENDAQIAPQIAQRFVRNRDVLAVIGHNSSDASLPASGVYQQGQLVMISPTSGSTGLTELPLVNGKNYIYRTAVNYEFITDLLADYLSASGHKKIGMCIDSKSKDRTSEKAFEDSVRAKNLMVVDIGCDFATSNVDFSRVMDNAEQQKVDAIFLNPNVDRFQKAFQFAGQNQGRFTLIGNPSLGSKITLEQGKYSNNLILGLFWHIHSTPNHPFVEKAISLWRDRDVITWRTASSYDATNTIAQAISQSQNPDRPQIQQALASNDFVLPGGVTGDVRFSSQGDRTHANLGVIMQVQPDPRNLQKYDFIPHSALRSRISQGEQLLFKTDNSQSQKLAGIKAYAAGDYQTAIANFTAAQKTDPDDPETAIYEQNARAASAPSLLKIAVVVPLVTNPNVSKEILAGIALAQSEINQKGGIQGKLLQVVIANDDNQPEIATQLAHNFVNDPDILAVIGSNVSDASVAACPIYQQGQLVNISPTSFSLALSTCGSYVFRTSPDVRFIANSLSSYATNRANAKKLVVCNDEQAKDGQSLRDEFTRAVKGDGGEILKIPCDFSSANFNAVQVVNDAIRQGANGILIAPHVDRINGAIEVAIANRNQLQLYGNTSLYTPQSIAKGKDKLNGLILPANWHPQGNFNQKFTQAIQKRWSNRVSWRAATSYDAAIAIITGLQTTNLNQTNPQKTMIRQQLQQALRKPDFSAPGATGTIQFLPSGDRDNQKNLLLQIQPDPKSPSGFNFALKSGN